MFGGDDDDDDGVSRIRVTFNAALLPVRGANSSRPSVNRGCEATRANTDRREIITRRIPYPRIIKSTRDSLAASPGAIISPNTYSPVVCVCECGPAALATGRENLGFSRFCGGSAAAAEIPSFRPLSPRNVRTHSRIDHYHHVGAVDHFDYIEDRAMFIPDSLRSCMVEPDMSTYLQAPSSGQVCVPLRRFFRG